MLEQEENAQKKGEAKARRRHKNKYLVTKLQGKCMVIGGWPTFGHGISRKTHDYRKAYPRR